MSLKTFERGVHPSYYKEQTSSKPIETPALPKAVVVPLQQHVGASNEPLVKKGDMVEEGLRIGDVSAYISAPVHASLSGKVKDIDVCQTPSGARSLAVFIEGDGSSRDWPAVPGAGDLSPEAVREAIREAGVVGMGGAAFPTSVKLSIPKGRSIDTFILNGCECEPFLTADHRVMVEEPHKAVKGLMALMKATGAKAGIIGIEENKPDAVHAMQKAINGASALKIIVLETKYPQGAEKMLIRAVLGRKVPLGKLPLDAGVVVNNVGTAVAAYDALYHKKPLIERVITVNGSVNEPKNLRVRIGASFGDVIALCGGVKSGVTDVEVLNGGPMMGIAQSSLLTPVVKGTSGVTVLSSGDIKPLKYDPCIKCARCVEACPMGLMPYKLGDQGRTHMGAEFTSWGGFACIECGCCSYVCPAKRPLLQWIRVGKFKARQAEKKEKVS